MQGSDYGRVMREYATRRLPARHGRRLRAPSARSRRTAKEFPNVAFLFGSGAGPAEPNFGVFDNWIHEPAYLSGLIAGKMTKSNTIGAVAAMGIPEVNRLVNAFFAGAREVNPNVKRKVTFIGSFFDPPKAKEAAIAQIDTRGRRDLRRALRRHRGGQGPQDPGDLQHVRPVEPRARHGRSRVRSGTCTRRSTQAIKLVKAGVFTAQDYGDFSRMSKGGSFLAPYHAFDQKLPADVKDLVEKKKAEILEGNFRVDVDEATPVSD